jgi:hypothetical protein
MRSARRAILSSYGAARVLAGAVEGGVRAQDHGASRRDAQPRGDRHAPLLEVIHLLCERVERHHDAVADQADDAVAQDARWDEVQHGLLRADDEGVPGVVPALKTHDRARAIGERIDDSAFALVAPLGSNHNDASAHASLAR